ncbi:MAG: acyl-CoA dehydrogenase family protein [Acidimicrobiales bacterium]
MSAASAAATESPTSASALQDEVRSWLAENWDPSLPLGEWWARLADAGWSFPHFPIEWSGRGLSSADASIVEHEIRAAGAYGPPHGIATMMVAPMVLELGTEEQKAKWLPGIVRGTDVWCQLFSEPGAGSDLAGVSTRAVLDGDEWIVNGQKVWTSGGHYAKRAILVARTDPAQPKHRGLSFFVIEMDQPGVEVRPLVQMTGDAEFNEVFLTDAVVPAESLIGDVGGGWSVALRTLSYERGSLDPEAEAGIQFALDHDEPAGRYASGELNDGTRGFMPTGSEAWRLLCQLAAETGSVDDPLIRQELARLYRLVRDRPLHRTPCGRNPGGDRPAARSRGVAPQAGIGPSDAGLPRPCPHDARSGGHPARPRRTARWTLRTDRTLRSRHVHCRRDR